MFAIQWKEVRWSDFARQEKGGREEGKEGKRDLAACKEFGAEFWDIYKSSRQYVVSIDNSWHVATDA